MSKLMYNIGDKYGHWTIVGTAEVRNKQTYVKVQCDCGTISEVSLTCLLRGKTTQCKKCSARSRLNRIEIGTHIKHWTVLEGPIYQNHTAYYKVRCDCGKELLKLPIEILNPNGDFQCASCAQKENKIESMIANGMVGDLALTQYTRLKKSAKRRNYEFSVSIEYLWNLYISQGKRCSITGDLIPNIREASLDRIDSNLGYIEGNVQWVTYRANISKHTMTMNELYEFCKKVLNHANQQPSTPLTKCEGSETNS